MHIWVDADACPLVIKEILYRAAERAGSDVDLMIVGEIRLGEAVAALAPAERKIFIIGGEDDLGKPAAHWKAGTRLR